MPKSTHWTTIASYFSANVLFGAGVFFHGFLYNFYLDALGHAETVMGGAQAALTAGSVLALLPAGRSVDRIGSRGTIVVAVVLNAAGLTLSALVESPAAIYATSLLAGVGVGAWRVGLAPLLMQLAAGRVRSRAFSWNVALLVGTGGIWIAVAGQAPLWFAGAFGVSELVSVRLALLLGVIGPVLSVLFYLTMPGRRLTPPSRVPTAIDETREAARPLRIRYVAVLVAFVALWMTGPALVAPFFNIFFARAFDMPIERIGIVFAIAHGVTALVIFWSGELAARSSPQRVLAVWMFVFGPVLLGLAVTNVLAVAIGLYFVQGIVSPATNPLIDQILLERAAPDRRGLVSSLRNAATEGSAIWGAAAGGVILNVSSFALLFAVAGGLGVAAAACLLLALVRWRVW